MKHLSFLRALFLGTLFTCSYSANSCAASVSDLLITEIMANPSAVTDTNGEWFELFNPTNESVDLSGLILSDDGSNSHIIGSAFIDSGSYFVMARNGDSASNGGFTADYLYSGFALNNTTDQIVFSDSSNELLRLNYDTSVIATTDRTGKSLELIDAIMSPDNYAATSTTFGDGDFGTPGTVGSFSEFASPVPVPSAAWLMGSGLLGLIGFSRRKPH